MTSNEKKDITELKKQVSIANQRIRRIQKVYGEGTWGLKKLYASLDNDLILGITKGGAISVRKEMTDLQIKAIRKATNIFLKNESTSTLRGIKKNIKRIKKGIKEKIDVTDEEAEVIYEAFGTDLIKWITNYIDPSAFWALVQEIQGRSYSVFEKEIFSISSDLEYLIEVMNDLDVKEKLKEIYRRYV